MGALDLPPTLFGLRENPSSAANLLCGLLHPDPVDRLGVAGVMAHPWFGEVDWEAVAAGGQPPPPFDPSVSEVSGALDPEQDAVFADF